MRRVRRYVTLFATVLFLLCLGKRTNASELAVHFIFPNLGQMTLENTQKLPITSEMEDTVVEMEASSEDFMPDRELELREQLAEENRLSFETLLEEEETSQAEQIEEVFDVVYTNKQARLGRWWLACMQRTCCWLMQPSSFTTSRCASGWLPS